MISHSNMCHEKNPFIPTVKEIVPVPLLCSDVMIAQKNEVSDARC